MFRQGIFFSGSPFIHDLTSETDHHDGVPTDNSQISAAEVVLAVLPAATALLVVVIGARLTLDADRRSWRREVRRNSFVDLIHSGNELYTTALQELPPLADELEPDWLNKAQQKIGAAAGPYLRALAEVQLLDCPAVLERARAFSVWAVRIKAIITGREELPEKTGGDPSFISIAREGGELMEALTAAAQDDLKKQ